MQVGNGEICMLINKLGILIRLECYECQRHEQGPTFKRLSTSCTALQLKPGSNQFNPLG